MARADLLKRLFASHQKRDEPAFRSAAIELIEEERKKRHDVLAAELTRALNNGTRSLERLDVAHGFEPVPVDADRKTPLLQVRTPDRDLADLVLDIGSRSAVERVIREVRSHDVLEAHGLAAMRRLLFCGPPGCGKTVTAQAIACELNLPLIYVRFDAVVSSLLGETSANIRKVFEYASRGQWVVLFDEFDAIGRSRDDATEHGEIKRVVNSFLQLLDNFRGESLVIAATNFEQVLDPAIWRRFDDVIRFERPDAAGLREVMEKRTSSIRLGPTLLAELVLALEGATHADAERVAVDLRKACALSGVSVVRALDVDEALARWRYRQQVLKSARGTTIPHVDEG